MSLHVYLPQNWKVFIVFDYVWWTPIFFTVFLSFSFYHSHLLTFPVSLALPLSFSNDKMTAIYANTQYNGIHGNLVHGLGIAQWVYDTTWTIYWISAICFSVESDWYGEREIIHTQKNQINVKSFRMAEISICKLINSIVTINRRDERSLAIYY